MARIAAQLPERRRGHEDGAIWFTGSSYGHLQGFRPGPIAATTCIADPTSRETMVVADGFDKPNGIAFSPDERVLYLTYSGANQEPAATTSPARITSRRSMCSAARI